MTLKELTEKIKKIKSKPYFPKLLLGAGIAAMLLIMLNGFSDKKEENVNSSDVNTDFLNSYAFMDSAEARLTDVLTSIEGVGKAKVLVNIAATEEYVYAEEQRSGSNKTENSYVIIDKGSEKEALISKVTAPAISGIIIVCEGGDDPKVCEKVYKAVSTALNIPTNRIYVAEMK